MRTLTHLHLTSAATLQHLMPRLMIPVVFTMLLFLAYAAAAPDADRLPTGARYAPQWDAAEPAASIEAPGSTLSLAAEQADAAPLCPAP